MGDCPFCAYALGEVPLPEGGHQRDGVMAFPPLNPFVPGHTLFVPVAHVTDITAAPNPLIVHVDNQAGRPTMWAQVDTDRATELHRFLVVGTGHPLPDTAGAHVATWQDGPFVWHLYAYAPGAGGGAPA